MPLREPLFRAARRKHLRGFHHRMAEEGHGLRSLGRRGYGFRYACACGAVGLYRARVNDAWRDWCQHLARNTTATKPPKRPPSRRKLPAGYLKAR